MNKALLKKLARDRDGFKFYDNAVIKGLAQLSQKDVVDYCRRKPEAAKRLGISTYDLEKLVHSCQRQPQEQINHGFKLIKAFDLKFRAPEWLINGLIEDDTLGLMFGDSESGKTFLAMMNGKKWPRLPKQSR